MSIVYRMQVPFGLDVAPFLPLFSRARQEALLQKTASHRALSVCGSLLLLYGLRDQGREERLNQLVKAPGGKPFFPGLHSPRFNISHSGSMAVCALSDREIGVDIEQEKTRRDQEIVALFHPDEKAWFEGLPPEERTGAFYRLWAHKESYMKYTGLGASLPLDGFSVRRFGEDEMRPGAGCDPGCAFYSIELPGYGLAVCSRVGDAPRCIHIDFAKIRWEGFAL